jgi:hypothetical protein
METPPGRQVRKVIETTFYLSFYIDPLYVTSDVFEVSFGRFTDNPGLFDG